MFEQVMKLYSMYTGKTAVIFVCVLLAIIFILFRKKDKMFIKVYVIPGIVFLLLLFNPICIQILNRHMALTRVVRIIWLVPIPILLSYALLLLINTVESRKKKTMLLGLVFCVILLLGSYVFSYKHFKIAENPYKLPEEAIEICEAIKKDGYEGRLMPSEDMVTTIRQYDANIEMWFGRGEYPHEKLKNRIKEKKLTAGQYADAILNYAPVYVLLEKDKISEGDLSDFGYRLFLETDKHYLYKQDMSHYGECIVLRLASENMCYVAADWLGRLIVINGGESDDNNQLEEVIQRYGSKADIWIITNSSVNCIDAFKDIFMTEEYEIRKVLTTETIGESAFANEYFEEENIDFSQKLCNFTDLNYLQENERIFPLGQYLDVIYIAENGNTVIKFFSLDHAILFLSGISKEQAEQLLHSQDSRLVADYVQVDIPDEEFLEEVCEILQPDVILGDFKTENGDRLKKHISDKYGVELIVGGEECEPIVLK